MAYALREQYGTNNVFDLQKASSDIEFVKPRLTVLEGGLSKDKLSAEKSSVPDAHRCASCAPAERPLIAHSQRRSGLPVALIAFVLALVICAVSTLATQYAEAKFAQDLVDTPAAEYIVVSGDSLWAIAQTHPIDGYATSYVVNWISARNNLDGGLIVAGQRLLVPSQNG